MTNKEIVLKAMDELFHKRDSSAISRYWHEFYIQHNASMINGHEGLNNTLKILDPKFKWVPGIIVEEGNIVITHSLVHGWGPFPVIIADIFRLEDGKIAEHWDVVQEEVPASRSANGNPMTSFKSKKMQNKLTGNSYKIVFDLFKVKLFFESDESIVFTIIEGGQIAKTGHTEKVASTVTEIRPMVYMVSWKEISGATVTHLEDHENRILYSNVTMPDGNFYTMKGTINPVV